MPLTEVPIVEVLVPRTKKPIPQANGKNNAAPKFKPPETWTHTFFCLADREQIVALKARLQQAGLGRRKICFNWKATAGEVKTKLEEVYPKLETGGGFEIMRHGGAQVNNLIVIQPPRSGYSVPFLRGTAGQGQAIAFFLPIQINLDMQPEPLYMDNFEVLKTLNKRLGSVRSKGGQKCIFRGTHLRNT